MTMVNLCNQVDNRVQKQMRPHSSTKFSFQMYLGDGYGAFSSVTLLTLFRLAMPRTQLRREDEHQTGAAASPPDQMRCRPRPNEAETQLVFSAQIPVSVTYSANSEASACSCP